MYKKIINFRFGKAKKIDKLKKKFGAKRKTWSRDQKKIHNFDKIFTVSNQKAKKFAKNALKFILMHDFGKKILAKKAQPHRARPKKAKNDKKRRKK